MRGYPLSETILFIGLSFSSLLGQESNFVCFKPRKNAFPLFDTKTVAPIVFSRNDYPGLARILQVFAQDVEKLTGVKPEIFADSLPNSKNFILVGTVGKNPWIEKLIQNQKIDPSEIISQWEATLTQVVENPFPGIEKALVILGSDKRGTFYGLFDLSRKMGVSPWVWWADVPVKRQKAVYILSGTYIEKGPKVKYRGIFLNDEEPCLGRWAVENFGGFTHQFYEKVFELLLRLKGNYLWPAMWWASFNSDDPENPKLAHEMGIVMGTSHHEPMMRAHAEWRKSGKGPWDYEKNADVLREFWREGIRRMGGYESVVTIGMRGDGDVAMSESTNIALLERIVRDQRNILEEITGKPADSIPQVWALYKEVQDYFDKGMQVPEDVTLFLCDDNWGNVRWLPRPGTPPRKGGYGMYYHFDFVGGPRNYKWINTNLIPRIWEQMHLTYQHGVDRIWIVNVGDLKPMELPISFFLDYAWNPETWSLNRVTQYTQSWSEEQFGPEYAKEIGAILTGYTKINSRCKPELLDPDTYSLIYYREWERVVEEYNLLLESASQIQKKLSPEYYDAYYELVLHPVEACANLYRLYWVVAKNRLYAKQRRNTTNDLADEAERLFKKDAEISYTYNHVIAHGKWNHMMDQPHIGYTSWQQPDRDIMPKVFRIEVPTPPKLGVTIEGSDRVWPDDSSDAVLPECDIYRRPIRYMELFNRGTTPFNYSIRCDKKWIKIRPEKGRLEKETRVNIEVDWKHAAIGRYRVPIDIQGSEGTQVRVWLDVHYPQFPKLKEINGHIESEGVVSIEAEHFTKKVSSHGIDWVVIPNLGKTLSGVTVMPVTASSQSLGPDSPRLEYRMYLFSTGRIRIHAFFSPVQNFLRTQGLRYGISVDEESPQIVNVHVSDTIPDWKYPLWWNSMVANQIKICTTEHEIKNQGWHVLKFWMVDPGLVLQKIVVDLGGLKTSYLGPPESFFIIKKN